MQDKEMSRRGQSKIILLLLKVTRLSTSRLAMQENTPISRPIIFYITKNKPKKTKFAKVPCIKRATK